MWSRPSCAEFARNCMIHDASSAKLQEDTLSNSRSAVGVRRFATVRLNVKCRISRYTGNVKYHGDLPHHFHIIFADAS